jgi:mannitol/fructose-specific phosphotransferase system IIA component (Ntr-type)
MNKNEPIVLSELLRPATINLQLSGGQREAVLAELINQIPDLVSQPAAREKLLRALEEREQLHSTGIGDGVALPHARNALVGLVNHPIMVFGRHDAGVAYGAIDNAPAKLFFLLIAPTVTQHLSMLARISRILRDPKVRKSLLVADSADKVVKAIKDAETKQL